MKAQEIYSILRAGGLSRAGALGMLGNMAAESGLKENIAQRGMTKLTDEQYTAAADNGLIDFTRDATGFGLCQWTFWSRKQSLLNYAKQCGVSVGNGVMQVEFALKELLEGYPALWQFLCTTDDIDTASDRICSEFERPAVNNFYARRDFAHGFEAETNELPVSKPKDPVQATFPPDPSIMILQMVLQFNGYWDNRPDGYKSKELFDKLDEFVKDLRG